MSTIDTSSIDPTKPQQGAAFTADLRSNLARIKDALDAAATDVDAAQLDATQGIADAATAQTLAEDHDGRHLPSGADPLTTAAPATVSSITGVSAEGSAESFARSDHAHRFYLEPVATADLPAPAPGESARLAFVTDAEGGQLQRSGGISWAAAAPGLDHTHAGGGRELTSAYIGSGGASFASQAWATMNKGSYTIPGGTLNAGDRIEIRAIVHAVTVNGNTFNVRLRVGGENVGFAAAGEFSFNVIDAAFCILKGSVLIRDSGATGNFVGNAEYTEYWTMPMQNVSGRESGAIDLTANQDVEVQLIWSGAGSSAVVERFEVEIVPAAATVG